MALIINGKKFTPPESFDLIIKIIAEITQLPKPVVHPMEKIGGEAEKDALIILQREQIFLSQKFPIKTAGFIGTKNLLSCIFLFLTNGVEHAAVHVDESKKLNLIPLLDKFKESKKLTAIILGGYANDQFSMQCLIEVIQNLLEASETLALEITLEKQNILSVDDEPFYKYKLTYDRILEEASDAFYHLYNKKKLLISYFKDRSVSDFETRTKKKEILDLKRMKSHFMATSSLVLERNRKKTDQHLCASGTLPTEERFYTIIDALFSIEGFELMGDYLRLCELNYKTSLTDFSISLDTLDVFAVSRYMGNYFGLNRTLMSADVTIIGGYYLPFDSSGKSVVPPNQKCFFEKNESLEPELTISRDFYFQRGFEKEPTVALKCLHKLVTHEAFIMVRKPSFVVDALILVPEEPRKEKELTQRLKELDLQYCQIVFEKKYFCIPAINFGKTAEKIQTTFRASFPSFSP